MRSRIAAVISAIEALVTAFKPHCADCTTCSELAEVAADNSRWRQGHELFRRIRDKTLEAEARGTRVLVAQYVFEEVCAKTIYNLSLPRDPFDPDSPFWIATNALTLARHLNISDTEIVRIIMFEP